MYRYERMSIIIPSVPGTLVQKLPPNQRIVTVIKHSGSDPDRYDVLLETEHKEE